MKSNVQTSCSFIWITISPTFDTLLPDLRTLVAHLEVTLEQDPAAPKLESNVFVYAATLDKVCRIVHV